MSDILHAETPRQPLGWPRALIEAFAVLATVVPAILLMATLSSVLGINSPALPPTGILLSVLVASVFLWRGGLRWGDIGLKVPGNLPKAIGFGVLGTVIGFALFALVRSITNQLGFPPPDVSVLSNVLEGNFSVYIQFMVLVVWGSAGIGEEMFARGFLLHRLEAVFANARSAWWLAAITQAVVFGALHFYQGPTGMIGAAVIGFLMALLFRYTGRNLLAPILAHGLIDTVAVTALYMGVTPA